MDVNHPQWEAYQNAFEALAEQVPLWPQPTVPDLTRAEHYLCLYGENGLEPDEEFALLETLRQNQPRLFKREVETSYWLETILFCP